jgi:hypothetical protein
MKFSWRAALCALVMVGATGAFKSCNNGPSSGGEDPPKTADDKFEVLPTGVTSLAVLTNDSNLTHEPLTYTIEDSPTVGSASFNTDHTVALTLPSGFKGVTKFRYKITNSVGGFSISSAVVFVDVPAYRALFAAKGTAGTYELYVSDFLSSTKISSAVTGNVRLQNMWRSKSGQLVVYERGDPAQVASTTDLFFVKPTSSPSPVKFPLALGRAVISGATVAISDDSRWIAYPTSSTSASGQTGNLYVLDSNNAGSPTLVGSSANTFTALTQWIGNTPTLYFMASPGNINGHALFRADVSGVDAPQRISPVYASTDQEAQFFVSPDQARVLIVGAHGGQSGAFFIDPANPNVERRLTTDIPAGAVIEAYRTDDAVSRLTYLWRVGTSAAARLSVVDINGSDTPQTVLQADITGLSDLRADVVTALITRGPNGRGSDGTLFEVTLDRSANDVQIASNVSGGVYADTGDRVYLYSRTLAPSVIQRSDFERTPSALVRTNTPAGALFVAPIFQPSAAILEDATSGVVLVNAAAPGKTLKFTDLQIGAPPATLYPTLIGAQ